MPGRRLLSKFRKSSSSKDQDVNKNGIPDALESKRSTTDLNGNGIPDSLESTKLTSDLNGNGIPDVLESNKMTTDLNGNGIPDQLESGRATLIAAPIVSQTQVLLPTQIIEKPVAIHEEIRREQVEEIQPVINVEKLKTEVIQKTQPLLDREVKPVAVSERMLASEVLPTINQENVGMRSAEDISTVSYKEGSNLVIEKPALVMETEKVQIIEEIQPVIYKETIVPSLIKETKPVFQTIVEGTTFTQETLPSKQIFVEKPVEIVAPVVEEVRAPVKTQVMLPTQIVEKPAAIHEEIRREQIEEIQPVINVEKLKTVVTQKTQPLLDREVKPVAVSEKMLASEILPTINEQNVGMRSAEDISSVTYKDSTNLVIEKPAIYMETEKVQVIEEIQPVIYKETIVPTLIKETKPVFQTINEGTVYTQETLPSKQIFVEKPVEIIAPVVEEVRAPVKTQVMLPTQIVQKPATVHEEIKREQVEEIQPVINVEKLKTEVIQKTQPLLDREVLPLAVTEKTLATEILPQITEPTIGARMAEDVSTISFKDTSSIVIEKPALVMETEKVQIIEEIQPVIYKETIVPVLIKETKPVYQTIIEGTTYTHTTLAPQQLKGSVWASKLVNLPATTTVAMGTTLPVHSNDLNNNGIPDSLERKSLVQDLNNNGIPDKLEKTTYTSTTTNAPYAPIQTL